MSNYRLITRLERFNLSRQGPKGERGSPRSANSLPCFGLLVGRPIRDVPFPFERETAYLKAQPALSGSLPPSPSAESRVAAVWAPSGLRSPRWTPINPRRLPARVSTGSPLVAGSPPSWPGASPSPRFLSLSLSPSLVLFFSPCNNPRFPRSIFLVYLPFRPLLAWDWTGNESWDTFLGKSGVLSDATN